MADAAALRSMVGGWCGLLLVAGEKINGKMAGALTDDGKTIGSYSNFYFSSGLVDPYLLHIR